MDITDCGLYSACGDCFIVYQANEREQHFYYLYPGYDTAAILASTPFYSNETSKQELLFPSTHFSSMTIKQLL